MSHLRRRSRGGQLHAFPPVCPQGEGQRPLRPALRRYDPAQARIEAESVKAVQEKYQANEDADFRTRAILIKEQRAELAKHHVRRSERLLQAPALREVPGAAPADQRHPEGALRGQGLERPEDGSEGPGPDRRGRQDLLGDQEGLIFPRPLGPRSRASGPAERPHPVRRPPTRRPWRAGCGRSRRVTRAFSGAPGLSGTGVIQVRSLRRRRPLTPGSPTTQPLSDAPAAVPRTDRAE
ncbi:hypothetical protein SMICM304S_02433 [Streptomyces microflavus]